MSEKIIPIPARLKNVSRGGHVAGAEDIIDDSLQKTLAELNLETNAALDDLGALIEALYGDTIIIVSELPASGVTGKIYRVPGTGSYTDYMWDASLTPAAFVELATYTGGNEGDFFNVNAYNNVLTTPYQNAAEARGYVPSGVRKLGLLITYLLAGGWFTDQYIGTATDSTSWATASNWKTIGPVSVSQNIETGKTELIIGNTPALIVDNEPEAESDNLVKSGGVFAYLEETLDGNSYKLEEKTYNTYKGYWAYEPETGKMSGFVSDDVRRCFMIDVKYCTNEIIAITNGLFGCTVSKRWMITDAENNVIASDVNASSSITLHINRHPNARYIYYNMYDGSASTITFQYIKSYYHEELEKADALDLLYINENQEVANKVDAGLTLRLKDKLANQRNGNTKVFEIPFKKDKKYYVKFVSDSPLTVFAITNSGGVNILVEKNIIPNQIYNCDFSSPTASTSFNTYIGCEALVNANIDFSIWEYDDEPLQSRDLSILNESNTEDINHYAQFRDVLYKKELTLSDGADTYFTDITFKQGHTYRFIISCDNAITGHIIIANTDDAINNAKIGGVINNTPILLTMTSDSDGLFVTNDIENLACVVIITEEYANNELDNANVIRTANFTLPASTPVIADKYIIYEAQPYPVGNCNYEINIRLEKEVTISNGYINIYWNKSYGGSSSQAIHITDSKLLNNTFKFKATHKITNITLTLWLSELDTDVNGTMKLYCVGDAKLLSNEIIKKTFSNDDVFLCSYTKNNSDGGAGKMFLSMSTDGLHFHKLSDSYIFNANAGNGFEHDIFIIKKDNYFYITATTAEVVDNNIVLHLYKSKDLQNWESHAEILIPTSSFTYESGDSFLSMWAPEILLLNNNYYLSFAICEATTPSYIVKGYIADINDSFTQISNIRQLTLNPDTPLYTFDTTIYYDEEKGKYYAYTNDGAIYCSDSIDGTWSVIAILPLAKNGYNYMEGGTICKHQGFYFIYGDGTLTTGNVANNMLCFRTPDFVDFEIVKTQYDTKIRHPKIITSDCLTRALAEKVFTDKLNL